MNTGLELKLIQLILQELIYKKHGQEIENLLKNHILNWGLLKNLLFYHEIASFFYIVSRPYALLLPEKIEKILSWSYYHTRLKNQLIFERYLYIYKVFRKNDIKLLPIKGIALLFDIYDKFPARPMADIDILIHEADYEKTKIVLKNINYEMELHGLTESYWKIKQCHVSFLKNTKDKTLTPAIDVHLRLDFRRYGRNLLPDLWKNTRILKIDNKAIGLLSPEDTLFSLALHQRRFGSPLCLKYVLDTALLLKKYGNEFDWDYIYRQCKTERLRSCVYFLLLQCEYFLVSSDCMRGMQKLFINDHKAFLMSKFIKNNLASTQLTQRIKINYLKSHFLLYDSYLEPLLYILFIPIEQFAKFYDLQPYSIKTTILYRLRLLYMIYRTKSIFTNNKH